MYRICSTILTATAAFIVFGSLEMVAVFALADIIVKILFYYTFELGWKSYEMRARRRGKDNNGTESDQYW